MLEQLRNRLAEIECLEARGVEHRIDHPGQMTRAEEIDDLKGRIAAYERLARLGKNAKTNTTEEAAILSRTSDG